MSIYKTTRGFTLIELLVVIAIIGILASVVLAGLGSQRDRARQVSVVSSARSVVPVATVCYDDLSAFADPGTNANAAAAADLPAVNGTDRICQDGSIASDMWPDISNQGGWKYEIGNITSAAWEFAVYQDNGTTANDWENGEPGVVCSVTGCTPVTTTAAAGY
jgi:prepilin-type N-terminal cleavage/methylation domain-containing protein